MTRLALLAVLATAALGPAGARAQECWAPSLETSFAESTDVFLGTVTAVGGRGPTVRVDRRWKGAARAEESVRVATGPRRWLTVERDLLYMNERGPGRGVATYLAATVGDRLLVLARRSAGGLSTGPCAGAIERVDRDDDPILGRLDALAAPPAAGGPAASLDLRLRHVGTTTEPDVVELRPRPAARGQLRLRLLGPSPACDALRITASRTGNRISLALTPPPEVAHMGLCVADLEVRDLPPGEYVVSLLGREARATVR